MSYKFHNINLQLDFENITARNWKNFNESKIEIPLYYRKHINKENRKKIFQNNKTNTFFARNQAPMHLQIQQWIKQKQQYIPYIATVNTLADNCTCIDRR